MATKHPFPQLPYDPAALVQRLLPEGSRLLLVGESGAGKSTLLAKLAAVLAGEARACFCLSADPGSPAFGVPGAVNLAEWRGGGWQALDLEAVCSLDAGRFRLPLLTAVRRLLQRAPVGTLLIDTPGLVRGPIAAELLEGLLDVAAVQRVLVLARQRQALPLVATVRTLAPQAYWLQSPPEAVDPSREIRAQRRTMLWDAYLAGAAIHTIKLQRLPLLGIPPQDEAAWRGRQVGLLRDGRTIALGEALRARGGVLTLRLPRARLRPEALVVRDAVRAERLLVTGRAAVTPLPPLEDEGKASVARRLGEFEVTLVNGVFGDPLLRVRLRRERRSLLFDLGDASQLSAGALHTVSDVFITHAHIDHIGGFLWFLRHRLGEPELCRVYGPPGLADHLSGFLQGVLWDRIENRGPLFEVLELHTDRVERCRLQAGSARQQLGSQAVTDGLLLAEPGFQVRALPLDHGFGTSSLAYSVETPRQLKVRRERLAARGLLPGPWLGALKRRVREGDLAGVIETPDGRCQDAAALARDILFDSPGVKLVYATDFADTIGNRGQLTALARGADLLICEATFLMADADQAERTGHLTTRASIEIAAAAQARQFIPFHFSRRYQDRPGEIYAELRDLQSRLQLKGALIEVTMPNGAAKKNGIN
ncbi:MAG TPA: MBL fold metallo-hydrolase [Gammaproteobacteria bacterium]|nr:MBL fold metallo-hydrolase [Gammaproteobacteria bacterium]